MIDARPTAAMCNINSTSRRNALAQNRRNLLPRTVRTSRQGLCNQSVCCLLCSMARINNLWDGSLDKRKVHGLVSFCGQMAIELKYRNTPLIHTNTYIHGHDICRMSHERDSTTGKKMLALTAG